MVLRLSKKIGVKIACLSIGLPRSSWYYSSKIMGNLKKKNNRKSYRAMSDFEKQMILKIMNSGTFIDKAPAEIYATLLDRGLYYCSIRSMYRILTENNLVRERRNQRKHPEYTKPELLTTKPNELWSWDITKLKGPAKWTYFYLYVILDVFSRYVVGWMVAHKESAVLAMKLISESCKKQNIKEEQLTIHADRGSSMRSKPVALLMSDMGITKTHSRPHVSNDNPYSESQFKTLKYRPEFPKQFGCIEDSRNFLIKFFDWYNNEHYHSGISLLRPYDVHSGNADKKLQKRHEILLAAQRKNPERFINGKPKQITFEKEVWINKPKQMTEESM